MNLILNISIRYVLFSYYIGLVILFISESRQGIGLKTIKITFREVQKNRARIKRFRLGGGSTELPILSALGLVYNQ